MKCIVGLGNPGEKYAGTRHNIGWEVTHELARRSFSNAEKKRFDGVTREVQIGTEQVLILEPLTFMNLSGRAVAQLVKFYKLAPEEVLVVCDDMNLAIGKLRIRANGSSGGQKGLANILQALSSENVPRLRIGVGRPPGTMDAATFVLNSFRKEERVEMDLAVQLASDAAEVWVKEGVDVVMNRFNASSGPAKEA